MQKEKSIRCALLNLSSAQTELEQEVAQALKDMNEAVRGITLPCAEQFRKEVCILPYEDRRRKAVLILKSGPDGTSITISAFREGDYEDFEDTLQVSDLPCVATNFVEASKELLDRICNRIEQYTAAINTLKALVGPCQSRT